MVGIDEAGRGPVLGPMVYSVAFCSLETGKTLSKRSYADSKQLKEDKREVCVEGGGGWRRRDGGLFLPTHGQWTINIYTYTHTLTDPV